MGGRQSTQVPSRPTMTLSALRSLDIVLLSSRVSMMGIPIREEVARHINNRVGSMYVEPNVRVDRFDRVGIISIDDKAITEGITYETVNVITITPFGIRRLSLREALEMSEAVVIRPLIFPGESRRSPEEIPHPMKQEVPPGTRQRRSNSWVNFSNTYSLAEIDDSSDPLNGRVHDDFKITRRRMLHTKFKNIIRPLLGKTYDDPEVMSRFEGIYTWFLKHLAGAAPSDDELLRLDELVHIYCNNKAKERRDKFVDIELRRREIAKKLALLTDYELAEQLRESGTMPDLKSRHSTRRSSATNVSGSSSSSAEPHRAMRESQNAFVLDKPLKINKNSNVPSGEKSGDLNALNASHFNPTAVMYGDILGLLAMVAQSKQVRCTFNDEEMHQLIEMFLDPTRDELAITVKEMVKVWADSLHRNTDAQKTYPVLLSGGIISYILQELDLLPKDPEHIYRVHDFCQPSRQIQTALKGPLLGREFSLDLPSALQLSVLDAVAARQEELLKKQQKEAQLAQEKEKEKERQKQLQLRATRAAEQKKRAEEEAKQRQALADRIAKEIERDAELKRDAERKEEEAERERNRLEREREFLERKAKKTAEKMARQAGMSTVDRMLDLDGDDDDMDDDHEMKDIDPGVRSHRNKVFSFTDSPQSNVNNATARSNAVAEDLARQQFVLSQGDRAMLIALSAADLPPEIAYNGPFSTMCAIWALPGPEDEGATFLTTTPSVASSLSPSYDSACLVSFTASASASNRISVVCYLASSAEQLAAAPVVGSATVDLVELIKHPVGIGKPPLLYDLVAPDGSHAGVLQVLQYTDEMSDLVLVLGGESQIFAGENVNVQCTYSGLAGLLAAAGHDLDLCLSTISTLENQGVRFASMNALAVAVATSCKAAENSGTKTPKDSDGFDSDYAYPAVVRDALLSFLSRPSCSLVPSVVDFALPEHTDELLALDLDPNRTFGRLCYLEAIGSTYSTFTDLAVAVSELKADPAAIKPVARDDEDDSIRLAVASLLTSLPNMLVNPSTVTQEVLALLVKDGGMGDVLRLKARADMVNRCQFKFVNLEALVAALTAM